MNDNNISLFFRIGILISNVRRYKSIDCPVHNSLEKKKCEILNDSFENGQSANE